MSKLNLVVGKKIRALRRSQDITQVVLAAWVGVSQPYLSKVEGGRAELTAETLYKISRIFKTDMEELCRE